MSEAWTIVGQGLAGTCLAWELWKREVPFTLIDREQGGSSRVAAGLINPVTGKNYEPSAGIGTFLPLAMDFYAAAEPSLRTKVWHPFAILRLAATEKEWQKMQAKAQIPEVAEWIADGPTPMPGCDWFGRLVLQHGGRLDTRAFLDSSREFFSRQGRYQQGEIQMKDAPPHTVWCDGATGLISGRHGEHRCAKGEILTVEASNWDNSTIRIGAGGWLVPAGENRFKIGATYEWEELDDQPTDAGRKQLERLAHRLGGPGYEIIDHEAGIRPILRRSQPLIGPLGNPQEQQWMFNALGSKGSLYAPGIARQLANWLIEGEEADRRWDIRKISAR